MNKRFPLLAATTLLIGMTAAQAQVAPVDFETGGHGANWTWTVFENDTNPAVQIVSNPAPGGVNTSSTVALFTALQSGNPWAGCETQHGSDIGTFSLDETNCTVRVMVYKTEISNVGVKFAKADGSAANELLVANTLVNQWEELVFDFSGRIGDPLSTNIDQFILFPDFNMDGRAQDNLIYYDNISFGEMLESDAPETAAPTPSFAAANVISLFSDAYTNVTVDTWSADWDQADVGEVQIEGNATKRYSNLVYAGIEFTSETIDATGMTSFYMDIWTPDAVDASSAFNIKLVDFGADGVWSGGDDVEHELVFNTTSSPALASGQWITFNLPLSNFSGLVTRGHMAQLVIGGSLPNVYVDNVLFHNSEVVIPEPTVAAPTPTVETEAVLSLFSNAYSNVSVDTWSTEWDVADVADIQVAGNDTKLYTNLVYAGIEFSSQTLNASSMTHFHMDLWTPSATSLPNTFKIKLVDFGADGVYDGGDDVEHELTLDASSGLISEGWLGINVPLSEFTALTTRGHLAQLILSGTLSTIYLDNIYFYDETLDVEAPVTQPALYHLGDNYPNPFNPGTTISFSTSQPAHVELSVFDLLGNRVATLMDSDSPATRRELYWNGRDAQGRALANGVYFYQLSLDGQPVETHRMLMLK